MWWILRPEFIAFVDKIIISPEQLEEERNSQTKSGYHKITWDRLEVLLDNDLIAPLDFELDNSAIEE